MKKMFLKCLSSCLLILGVVACGEGETPLPDPGDNNGHTQNPGGDREDDDKEDDDTEIEKFDIVTKDNGLSIEKDSFEFAAAKDGDTFVDDVTILAVEDNSWHYVSGLSDKDTKLISENQDVIPDEALEIEEVTNSDLEGASGSNEIEQIKIKIDRTKVKPGTTKVKLTVKPSNGPTTVTKLTTLCINAKVYAYGTMEIDTYNLDFKLDLTGLDKIVADVTHPKEMTFSLADKESGDYYGYNYDSIKSIDIHLEDIPKEISFNDFKFAKGHSYNVQIFIEAKVTEDRTWILIEKSGTSSKYDIEVDKTNSTLTLTGDVMVEAKLGDTFTIADLR